MSGIFMQQDNTIPQPPQNTPQETPPQNNPQPPRRRKSNLLRRLRGVLSNLGVIIAAPIVAIFLITFVFQSYEVDGPSMLNTLEDNDRLVVLKIGKSISDIRDQSYIPKRHEIIVFHKRNVSNGVTSDRQLIKRVIGLPGERVVVRDGEVTVYNDEHPTGYNPDANTDYQDNITSITPGNVDITVPRDEVFVLGDNRDDSSDSRRFGTVESSEIVGRLVLRIFPLNSFKAF